MKATPEPKPGEKRVASMFQVRLSTQHVSTLDVLFSKAKVTKGHSPSHQSIHSTLSRNSSTLYGEEIGE